MAKITMKIKQCTIISPITIFRSGKHNVKNQNEGRIQAESNDRVI